MSSRALVHYPAHKGKPVDMVFAAAVCHLLPAPWVRQEGHEMEVMSYSLVLTAWAGEDCS